MTENNDPTLDTPAVDKDEATPVDSSELDFTTVDEPSEGSPSDDASASDTGAAEPSVPGDSGPDPVTDGDSASGTGEPSESSSVPPTGGDAADTVEVPERPGAATPTVTQLAPEDDPDGATFAAGTGDDDTPVNPPEEATFSSGTEHREHEVDDSVTDNTPLPTDTPDGGLGEWNELKNMVAEIHSAVTDLSELIEAARPAIQRVTEEVQTKGLMGLVAALVSGNRNA